ncbi:hypothetical protein [Helicobacter sp. T3_23-1059]
MLRLTPRNPLGGGGYFSSLRAIRFCIFTESNSWQSTYTTKSCHTEALKKPKYL